MCRREKADAIDFKMVKNIPHKILYTCNDENSGVYNLGYMTALVETWGNLD